jgi:hypothetical protein
VGLKSLKSLNLTNVYPNNKNNKNKNKKKNNKVKSKPLELRSRVKNLTLDVKKSNSSNETPNVMTVGVENYGLKTFRLKSLETQRKHKDLFFNYFKIWTRYYWQNLDITKLKNVGLNNNWNT